MKIDIAPRGAGKTTRAVKWVKEGRVKGQVDSSNRILVVCSKHEKDNLLRNFGLGYHEVESWNTILNHYYLPALKGKELYLDNADMFLERMFHGRLVGISLTSGEEDRDD